MNRSTVVAAIETVVAVAALVFAAWCWHRGVQHTDFAPSGRVPAFTATRYIGPWLFLAGVLVTGAALLGLDVGFRVVRGLRGSRTDSAASRTAGAAV